MFLSKKNCFSKRYCPTGTLLKILSYRNCPKGTVLQELSQRYCPTETVPKVLSYRNCPKGTVLQEVSNSYYLIGIVLGIVLNLPLQPSSLTYIQILLHHFPFLHRQPFLFHPTSTLPLSNPLPPPTPTLINIPPFNP